MNSKRERIYNFISIAVIFVVMLVFMCSYKNFTALFRGMTLLSLIILAVTVFLVHLIKAGRLYLAFYGSEIRFVPYIKTYCKVTPVSVVIPFKLGEFFRMYCYGHQLGNVPEGIIIILLDRFMDTIALVTVILLVWIFYGGSKPTFVYLLFIFLIFALLIYLVFPGVFRFWKMYLLRARATENKLSVLKMLETLNKIYQKVAGVAKGRGIILYFMSLAAWGVEIVSISLLSGLSKDGKLNQTISDYLTAAINGNHSVQLKRFVFVSVILLIAIYVIIKAIEMISGRNAHRV